jgi:signal transduction histidine kinase
MNRLIQDLLDVTMAEADQLKVECARIDTRDLVREAAEAQTALATSSDLTLQFDAADAIPDIYGDRDRLLQVFGNLIGNAIKFTRPGGRITISAATQHNEVRFAVADTGAGIAPENLAHIFDRFWQEPTKKRRLGAGLGLPITRGIVVAHGGRIWVESVVGQGSTFFFTIPVVSPKHDRPLDPRETHQIARWRARR